MTMRTLIDNVIQWAEDRNILEGSTAIKQLDKTSEEFNELQRAINEVEFIEAMDLTESLSVAYDFARARMVDGFGDILVTLIISARMLGIDLEVALESAWEEIKDRKGKMINGKFVKESDL